jgi:hypothetical protein
MKTYHIENQNRKTELCDNIFKLDTGIRLMKGMLNGQIAKVLVKSMPRPSSSGTVPGSLDKKIPSLCLINDGIFLPLLSTEHM